MKHRIYCSSLSLLLLGFAACASRDVVRAPATAPVDLLARTDYPQVIYQDGLDQDLTVHDTPIVTRQPGSQSLHVRLTLRSVSDYPLNFSVQFAYYGADGAPVTESPVWQQFTVAPRSKVIVEGDSIISKAVQWEAQIRR